MEGLHKKCGSNGSCNVFSVTEETGFPDARDARLFKALGRCDGRSKRSGNLFCHLLEESHVLIPNHSRAIIH